MADSKPPSKKKTATKKAAAKAPAKKKAAAKKTATKKAAAKKVAAKKTAKKKAATPAKKAASKKAATAKKAAKDTKKATSTEAKASQGKSRAEEPPAESPPVSDSPPPKQPPNTEETLTKTAEPPPSDSTPEKAALPAAEPEVPATGDVPEQEQQQESKESAPASSAPPSSAAPARKVLSLIDEPPKRRRRKRKQQEGTDAAPEAGEEEQPPKKTLEDQKKEALSLFEEQEKRQERKAAKKSKPVSETTSADAAAAGVLPPISRLRAEQEGLPESPTAARVDEQDGEGDEDPRLINIKPPIIVKDLAERMDLKPFKLIQDLMEMDIFANPSQSIEPDIALQLCEKHGFVFEKEKREKGGGVHKVEEVIEEPAPPEEEEEDELKVRPPIITFMGHVDHGKTSLLDALRKARVAAGEAGGITQHIGAYSIEHNGHPITFLDTPGHAAFTAMRARGANVTDIVILVVAADDGFMPQTIEALNHAKAANVKIVVAINKCDLPSADPMKVMTQMQENDIAPEEWGGNTSCVQVSATTGQGLEDLLEIMTLEAEVLELRANPDASARALVIESRLQPGRGPTASVIAQTGTLKVGAPFICGSYYGKIKSLLDDQGKSVKSAGPAMPVELVGFSGLPNVGDEVVVMESEKAAKKLSEERLDELRKEKLATPQRARLDSMFDSVEDGPKRLNLLLKTDVQGTVEAIKGALEEIKTEKVNINFLHAAAGPISESDVLLSSASDAVILGFNTKVENNATKAAKREGVEIKLYSIIYELIDQVKEAMLGMLDAETRENVIGHASVKQIFKLSRGVVAGCLVTDGRISKTARARVLRGGQPVFDGGLATLRRFKDDVAEVRNGLECGIRLGDYKEYEVDDVIECYELEHIEQTL